MYLYRYMSNKEFEALLAGKPISGDGCKGRKTTSYGKCFLPEVVEAEDKHGVITTYTPTEAYEYLYGLVAEDILVKFYVDTKDEPKFKVGYGTYADMTSSDWASTSKVKEYSIPKYDKYLLAPIAYCTNFDPWKYGTDDAVRNWKQIYY